VQLTPTLPVSPRSDALNPTTAKDAATYVVDLLAAIGVDYVFGVPGGAIEPLMDALAVSQRSGGPRAVIARHEAGAAFMAEGYARQSGRLGVCCATSGPGATNLLTGVACAKENGIPMLAITGQPAISLLGRGALQESSCSGIDVVGMFQACTHMSTLVSHPAQVESKVAAAVLRALQPDRGPVHLSFPVDVLRSPTPRAVDPHAFASLLGTQSGFKASGVHALQRALSVSEQTVFVIGRGCAGAIPHVLAAVEACDAPFVVTPDAKGLVHTSHPLYRGVLGFAGHPSARAALAEETDTVVLVGSKVSEWTSAAWNPILLSPRLIHVDDCATNFLQTPMARRHILGDLAGIFSDLAPRLGRRPRDTGWDATAPEPELAALPEPADPETVRPQQLMVALRERMVPGTRFVADAGNSTAWAIHWLREPGGTTADAEPPASPWLHVLTEFAPMGWAIGAAVGMARADPSSPVVCLTGDGSYLMNGQEITVAAQESLPVVFVVLDDAALGMVKHGQRLAGAEQTAFELPQVDFAALATSLGVEAHTVRTEAQLEALDLGVLRGRRGPVLLDIRIDGEAVPPMSLRLQTLNEA
jgi:acetolactate synthase-1/2/3 large subunit